MEICEITLEIYGYIYLKKSDAYDAPFVSDTVHEDQAIHFEVRSSYGARVSSLMVNKRKYLGVCSCTMEHECLCGWLMFEKAG